MARRTAHESRPWRRNGAAGALCLAASLGLAAWGCTPAEDAPVPPALGAEGPYDLVLEGGRVMDPESGTDAILNVGISDGTVQAMTTETLEGAEVLDVSGLVVAPGFIDLHAHGQDAVSARLQALDGVTTQLDLEIGAYPVRTLVEARRGKSPLHFGASASHPGARMAQFDDLAVGHLSTQPPDARLSSDEARYAHAPATDEDVARIVNFLEQGLDDGGLGLGLGIVYTPGASRREILRLFELAAARDVPIFVHMRASPAGPIADIQEMLANAAATGASLHIVHLNSSTSDFAEEALELIRGARERGLDVTTEAYPYTAGSTLIQSALFDAWVDVPEERYQNLEWPATGERLTKASFERYRKEGGWVIIHSRSEEQNTFVTQQPDVIVASDGIPFLHGPAHPRGAGTYARVLGRYARDKGVLTLMEALSKMTLQPAQRLESFAPQMARKGRVKVGGDADLVVFDPDIVIDRSTYSEGDIPSAGIEHVLVGGVFVVRGTVFQEGVFPGQPILSAAAAQ